MKAFTRTLCAVTIGLCLTFASAHAGVIVGGTRVVFPAQRGEVTVRLTNSGDRPALVEAWIDTGNPHSTPDSVSTPLLITPPLFRMAPHKDQSLRIIFTRGAKPLPRDRESLFWLNVLEIPPRPTGEAAHKNTLQFAIRSRLKMFYRPAGLPGERLKAPDKLTFSVDANHGGPALIVHNPTPYYITISKIKLAGDSQPIKGLHGMAAPFGTLRLTPKDASHALAPGAALTFTTINDFGAGAIHKSTITQ